MRLVVLFMMLYLGLASQSVAADYSYINAEEMKGKIEAAGEMIILDIQVEDEFSQHHLPGAVPTYAYPVKTEDERTRIDQIVQLYEQSGNEIVIVCPRGEGGAKRGFDYLVSMDIPVEKISILEKGMAGWPYAELVEKN